MTRWIDLERAEPEFAGRVKARFTAHKHSTLATLRRDGSPRISGIETAFVDGDLIIGSMPGALKGRDLLRDPRLALHSPSEDPPEDVAQHDTWSGDAKVAGHAVVASDGADATPPGTRFAIDLAEVVLTYVGTPPDHLVIETWHEDRGLEKRIRR
jgi:hypothetical protein